jgi:hypothetical protein
MAAGADIVRAAVAVLHRPEGILDIKVDVTKLGEIPAPPVARRVPAGWMRV